MLDPVSLLATATAVFNGLKAAVAVGREAEDVFSQLGKWAGAVADLQEWIRTEEENANKPPPLFKKLVFAKSATAEAFDAYAAKIKIAQMEEEIRHMFTLGELWWLGKEGYNEFIMMRRSIKEKREKMVYEQIRRRKKLIRVSADTGLIAMVLFTGGIILYHLIDFMLEQSK
jgi:hypothetical protein